MEPAAEAPVWFVSDVHLTPSRPERTERFLRFLEQRVAPSGADLVVAGDLFDWWFGTPGEPPADVARVVRALEALPRPVLWLEGNHDLFVHHALGPASPVATSSEPVRIQRFGRTVHVEHGDLVDPSERGYRRFRALLRGVPGQLAARVVGRRVTRFVGSRAAAGSRDLQGGADGYDGESEEWLAAARRYASARPEDLVILGHGHWLGYWEGLACLGDWLRWSSYARLGRDGLSLWRYRAQGDVLLADAPTGAVTAPSS